MSKSPLVNILRKFRSIHKFVGILLALFLTIVAVSGVILGWKKDVALLQPVAIDGSSSNLDEWVSLNEIALSTQRAIDSLGLQENSIDRMDVRPDKGMIKVLLSEGYWEVQVDGKTGKVLSVAKRHADWIEHLHDGSLISDTFKVGYTNIIGLGLLTLAISGLWLWYGPKVIRRSKHH